MGFSAKKLLKKLNYLPRWAWYVCALCFTNLPGVLIVYLMFHVLEKMAKDEADEKDDGFTVDVDVDGRHVRVNTRSRKSSTVRGDDYTVTDEEDVQRRWQQTEASARRAYAKEEAKEEEPISEDASVAEVLREGRDALTKIRRANDRIPDAQLSAQIDSIENSCRQILSILEQRPQLLAQLRTFLRYYLPTTLRLLDARARLESTANTPKAREVRTRISEALGVIDKAFLKQVEALDAYRFIDLESEMDVLRDMLRADGLIDDVKNEHKEEEDDPFASVLGKRSKDDQNRPLASH